MGLLWLANDGGLKVVVKMLPVEPGYDDFHNLAFKIGFLKLADLAFPKVQS